MRCLKKLFKAKTVARLETANMSYYKIVDAANDVVKIPLFGSKIGTELYDVEKYYRVVLDANANGTANAEDIRFVIGLTAKEQLNEIYKRKIHKSKYAYSDKLLEYCLALGSGDLLLLLEYMEYVKSLRIPVNNLNP